MSYVGKQLREIAKKEGADFVTIERNVGGVRRAFSHKAGTNVEADSVVEKGDKVWTKSGKGKWTVLE